MDRHLVSPWSIIRGECAFTNTLLGLPSVARMSTARSPTKSNPTINLRDVYEGLRWLLFGNR